MKKNVKKVGTILLIAAGIVGIIFVGTSKPSYGYVMTSNNCGDLENTSCYDFLNGQ